MKAAIIVLEWPGSSPCRAPSRMALGMKGQACAVLCWIRAAKDGMLASQIFGDRLELVDRAPLLARQRPHDIVEAMVEMILDQHPLPLRDRPLDRVQLLGD